VLESRKLKVESQKSKKFEQVVQKIEPQSNLRRSWELKGGVSAQVTALEVEYPANQTKKLIVRQHGEVDRKLNPQIATDEFKLLQILESVEFPTPKPYYLDQSGKIFPVPYLVIEYIEGETEFSHFNLPDFILQLATQLSKIHKLDYAKLDLAFLPEQSKKYADKFIERPAKVDESLAEGKIRDVLEAVWPLPQRNKTALLHGDFWPGNILWRDGKLVGIIDWEDAELGDPLADLANTRLEILWAFGVEAMHSFTQHYKSSSTIDFTNLPYWDLCATLRPASKIGEWANDVIIEKKMREGHKLFITQAFDKLSL